MGKQIRFYMDTNDEFMFMKHVRMTGDVAIRAQTSEKGLEEFTSLSSLEGRRLGDGSHLWNRTLSPRPATKHFPQQGYYCLDFMGAEVINVMRSRLSKNELSMGRLHIDDTFLGADRVVYPKSELFLQWYSALAKWIRTNAVRSADGAYVLPGADALIVQGVRPTGHRLIGD
jgi:hypothetical protein